AAPLAVDIPATARSLPELTFCTLTLPPPASAIRHRWSAVPLSSNCTTLAELSGDMFQTPRTLPELRFWMRNGTPGASHCRAPPACGNDVIRSRAAPIGISVTVSTGADDATGPSC